MKTVPRARGAVRHRSTHRPGASLPPLPRRLPPHLRPWAQRARKARFVITITGSNHVRFRGPSGTIVICATSIGNRYHGVKAEVGRLKKAIEAEEQLARSRVRR